MRRGHERVLIVGVVTAVCWVLFATEALSMRESVKFMIGVAGLFVILASTLAVWTAYIGRMDLWENHEEPRDSREQARQAEERYLRRRAEDARMRDLMNPNSHQAPPTDRWFG